MFATGWGSWLTGAFNTITDGVGRAASAIGGAIDGAIDYGLNLTGRVTEQIGENAGNLLKGSTSGIAEGLGGAITNNPMLMVLIIGGIAVGGFVIVKALR